MDEPAPSSPPPPEADGSGALRVGCIAGLLVGVGLVALLGVKVFLPIHRARSWPETRCTMESAELDRWVDDEGVATTGLALRYRFQVDGRTYHSERYSLVDSTSSAEKESLVARLRPGRVVPCYYDPDDPSQAVLERDYPISGWLLLLAGLPLAIIGVWFLFYLRQLRREHGQPARAQWQVDRTEIDQLRLSPRRGHAGPILLAALATAVLSVMTAAMVSVPTPDRGWAPVWVADLLLSGAAALAAGLTLFYLVLRAIGPRLRLVLDTDRVRLGDTVELRFRLRGVATAVRSLHVFLEGREECGQRSFVFFTADLREVESHFVPHDGTVAVAIPADSVPSFSAGDDHPYRIAWLLRVRADVARWPDVDQEFELTVLPAEVAP